MRGRTAARAAWLALAALALAAPAAAASFRAYVGTYTPPAVAAGEVARVPSGPDYAHGLGIYLVDIDPVSGAMTSPQLVARTSSPTWLVLGPRRDVLYAANETDAGTVTAFRIDRTTGALTPLGATPTGGSPVSLALHASGKYVLAANYGGGSVAVLPIRPDGSLGSATDIAKTFTGPVATRVHMVGADHRGRFVVANDSAQDRVFVWRLEAATGTLVANDPQSFSVPQGAFPRHFVFSPDDRFFYNLSERDSMLSMSTFKVAEGRAGLTMRQRVSTLPPGIARNQTSELLITGDGRTLYAANRGHDSIAVFSAAADGTLTRRGIVLTGGVHPRTIAFDPAERFIFSLNQRSDSITTFRIERNTGLPRRVGAPVAIPSPAAMVFDLAE